MTKSIFVKFFLLTIILLSVDPGWSQMITGVWSGKINKQKVELKIIQKGDSLTGTSYYGSPSQYLRYKIKGYFDASTNEAVWWDDLLIDQKPVTSKQGHMELLSRADFNCPGSGRMTLDGRTVTKNDEPSGEVHLSKMHISTFSDEWDYVIKNYTNGGNDPDLIESIESAPSMLMSTKATKTTAAKPVLPAPPMGIPMQYIPSMTNTPSVIGTITSLTIEEKFRLRKKTFVTDIPLAGDSIELRFYDNAEIDGDSISLFLNDRLIYQNIRLTGNAYTIKLAVQDLEENSELVMVAENLGSIPPNTSLMVALVEDKRYEARLESTEGSSAMVRFIKR